MSERNDIIIMNGEKINLLNCLRKDSRSYYLGRVYLESGTDYYAEFECIPKGMIIHLTTKPNLSRYHVKDRGRSGVYEIPAELFHYYQMDKTNSPCIYQIDEKTYFLRGKMPSMQKDSFVAPGITSDRVLPEKESVDIDKLIFLKKLSGNMIRFGNLFPKTADISKYRVALFFGEKRYASIRTAKESDYENNYSLQKIKKLYGANLQNYSGQKISFIMNANQTGLYIPTMFYNKIGVSSKKCNFMYDGENNYYVVPPCEYSTINGEMIHPMDEAPLHLEVKESNDMTVMEALFKELKIFSKTAKNIFEDYQKIKRENSELKKALENLNIDTKEPYEEIIL